jgi:RNA polymerase sigma-70 factor (family 1)
MGIVNGIFSSDNYPAEAMEELGFDTLFNEYFDRLVYFSWQIVNDKEQARDIAQDSFVKYWHQRESVLPNKTAVKNFLYSTVRNASLNNIRHSKIVEGYVQLHGTAEPAHPPVTDAIITAEVTAHIHAALQSLPASHREISILSFFEDKKNHEIADELDMSINTVKKQKQRALQLLRMKLSPELMLPVLLLIIKAVL